MSQVSLELHVDVAFRRLSCTCKVVGLETSGAAMSVTQHARVERPTVMVTWDSNAPLIGTANCSEGMCHSTARYYCQCLW